MIRILYIARYHTPGMEHKIALMASQPDLAIWLVRPSAWQDEYGKRSVQTAAKGYNVVTAPLLGQANDPHRAIYQTLTFAMGVARPHLIHAEEEPDSLAALQIVLARRMLAAQAKLILHTWQNINRRKSWYVWWVMRTVLRSADSVLCANREAMSILNQMGYARPTAVIPPQGVDTQIFRPPAHRLPSAKFTIVYAGRFVKEKGLGTLFEAIRALGAEVQLQLVGDGPYRAEAQALARADRVYEQILFVPPVSAERMAQVLAQANAVVLPSQTTPVWKEQFGRILIEAMACRAPVIGSDSGAIPEVIGDAGLIFREGDANGLADCLRRLIESPDLRRDLSDRGYRRVMQLYTQERIAEQTAQFYRQMMI
jgi:glycosyltransferase involved in cell wall biosynthesis